MALKELAGEATGPLKGITVLDMTSVVFGAYATAMLGDLGAEVIKLESPGRHGPDGDTTRWNGPVHPGAADLGPLFLPINRNKRSVFVDLRQPDAKEALLALLPQVDVLATTVRYDGMSRLGLDYEAVKAVRPDIVYVHGSGYGAEGPHAGRPAYDDLIQAGCGLADLLRRTDGDPAARYMPTVLADKVCGHFMVQAITAALFHRERTGEGQFVEVPMLECMTSFTLVEHLYGHNYQPPTGHMGYDRVINPHRKPYPTLDGEIAILPYSGKQFAEFMRAAGLGHELETDPRFRDQRSRAAHVHELYELIGQAVARQTTQYWLDLLQPMDVPCARMNTLESLQEDEHLVGVEFFEHYQHQDIGEYVAMRPPIRFAATPANIRRHPPRLGEHTEEVLGLPPHSGG